MPIFAGVMAKVAFFELTIISHDKHSILSVSAIKRQFRILSRASTVISAENFERINAYRSRVFKGDDYKEGIKSFLEKRPPQYKGKAADLD